MFQQSAADGKAGGADSSKRRGELLRLTLAPHLPPPQPTPPAQIVCSSVVTICERRFSSFPPRKRLYTTTPFTKNGSSLTMDAQQRALCNHLVEKSPKLSDLEGWLAEHGQWLLDRHIVRGGTGPLTNYPRPASSKCPTHPTTLSCHQSMQTLGQNATNIRAYSLRQPTHNHKLLIWPYYQYYPAHVLKRISPRY